MDANNLGQVNRTIMRRYIFKINRKYTGRSPSGDEMTSLKVLLLTGRSLSQAKGKEYGKLSKQYFEGVATCELDPEDLKTLGISPGENVRVATKSGSVVVRAVASTQSPHRGLAFIPYGLWASMLSDVETDGTGMPSFKGVEAEVVPARGEKVPSFEELVKQISGGK